MISKFLQVTTWPFRMSKSSRLATTSTALCGVRWFIIICLPEKHKLYPVEAGTGRCGAESPVADTPSGLPPPPSLSPSSACVTV